MPPSLSPQKRKLISRVLTLAAVLTMAAGVVLIGQPFYTDLQAERTQKDLGKALKTATVREAF
jgi:hypothetical protein